MTTVRHPPPSVSFLRFARCKSHAARRRLARVLGRPMRSFYIAFASPHRRSRHQGIIGLVDREWVDAVGVKGVTLLPRSWHGELRECWL